MNSKKYVVGSFLSSLIILIDYIFNFIKIKINHGPMQYGYNPAEFFIDHSDFVLVFGVLSLIFSIISIFKENKWGWLAIGLPILFCLFAGFIYFTLSNMHW